MKNIIFLLLSILVFRNSAHSTTPSLGESEVLLVFAKHMPLVLQHKEKRTYLTLSANEQELFPEKIRVTFSSVQKKLEDSSTELLS